MIKRKPPALFVTLAVRAGQKGTPALEKVKKDCNYKREELDLLRGSVYTCALRKRNTLSMDDYCYYFLMLLLGW